MEKSYSFIFIPQERLAWWAQLERLGLQAATEGQGDQVTKESKVTKEIWAHLGLPAFVAKKVMLERLLFNQSRQSVDQKERLASPDLQVGTHTLTKTKICSGMIPGDRGLMGMPGQHGKRGGKGEEGALGPDGAGGEVGKTGAPGLPSEPGKDAFYCPCPRKRISFRENPFLKYLDLLPAIY